MKSHEILALIAPHCCSQGGELVQQSSTKSWVVQRDFSLLAGVNCQSSSATLHYLPCGCCLHTWEQVMFPIPSPSVFPSAGLLEQLSTWACPHLSWAAHQAQPSSPRTPQSRRSSPSVPWRSCRWEPGAPRWGLLLPEPTPGRPLRPNHTTEMPLQLHWITQQLLHSHRNPTSQPEGFKLTFPISQKDAAIPWLPRYFTGRAQVSLSEWAEETPWSSFISWWWCSLGDSC